MSQSLNKHFEALQLGALISAGKLRLDIVQTAQKTDCNGWEPGVPPMTSTPDLKVERDPGCELSARTSFMIL